MQWATRSRPMQSSWPRCRRPTADTEVRGGDVEEAGFCVARWWGGQVVGRRGSGRWEKGSWSTVEAAVLQPAKPASCCCSSMLLYSEKTLNL